MFFIKSKKVRQRSERHVVGEGHSSVHAPCSNPLPSRTPRLISQPSLGDGKVTVVVLGIFSVFLVSSLFVCSFFASSPGRASLSITRQS